MKKACICWGGWMGHEPEKCAAIFEKVLLAEGFQVDVKTSMKIYKDKNYMESLDLLVPVWTMAKIKREEEHGLLAAVKNGLGIAGWHGGMCDSFRNNVDYEYMCGGNWVQHPGGVIDYEINLVHEKMNDPIIKGLKDFPITSEQYYLHVNPGNEVLATTTFSGKHDEWVKGVKMPVVWKKQYGKGRVFYASFGHTAKDFNIPEAKEIVRRGMLWASESKHS
jgi:type 1 glutamine amidotransferase